MHWRRYLIETAVIAVQTTFLLALCATMGIPESEPSAASAATQHVSDPTAADCAELSGQAEGLCLSYCQGIDCDIRGLVPVGSYDRF